LLTTDRAGGPYVARNGLLTVRTDDGIEVEIAVAAGDSGAMVEASVSATLTLMARSPMPAREVASARYVPTKEQGETSPLLAACAAHGMTEREAIGMLFAESEQRRADVSRLATFQPPPAIHISADEGAKVLAAALKRARAIGAAWRDVALARRSMLRTPNATAAPPVRDRLHAGKDALYALGVDPEADDDIVAPTAGPPGQ